MVKLQVVLQSYGIISQLDIYETGRFFVFRQIMYVVAVYSRGIPALSAFWT